ncbi:MAG: hypothetical protein AB7S75_14910 [Desulfococcaceae bacterium]
MADLYDWLSYKPRFIPENKRQNILPLLKIYSLYITENTDLDMNSDQIWEKFYQKLSQLETNERVGIIRKTAERIADVQKWQNATGNLKVNNRDRMIYTIPNSDFIISVDTQHGEFEIHKYQKGNNHLGAVSFDGKRFKPKNSSRSLKL